MKLEITFRVDYLLAATVTIENFDAKHENGLSISSVPNLTLTCLGMDSSLITVPHYAR